MLVVGHLRRVDSLLQILDSLESGFEARQVLTLGAEHHLHQDQDLRFVLSDRLEASRWGLV